MTVTVPVETRTLTPEEIQLDGTWTLGDTRSLSLTANGEDSAKQIVTATPKAIGDVIHAGDLMIELSGRPLIGLDIPFDLYRDITPGDEGRDVTVIQTALADLGLYRGTIDGTYGSLTAQAVRTLYQHAGATAPTTDSELQDAVTTAQAALEDAVSAATQTQTATTETTDSQTTAPTTDSTTAVTEARETLTKAQFAADTPLPAAEIARLGAAEVTLVSQPTVGTEIGGASADSSDSSDSSGTTTLTVRSGSPRVNVRVPVAQKDRLTPGVTVTVAGTQGGDPLTGTVTTVSEFSQESTLGSVPGYDGSIDFGDTAVSGPAEGDTAIVTVAASTEPVSGLSVPLTAVRSEGDSYYVLVESSEDNTDRVTISITDSADGYAVVTSDDLHEGDNVVVGTSS